VNAEQRERLIIALRHYNGLGTIAVMLAFALGTLGGASGGCVRRVLGILAILIAALCGYRFIRLRPLWRDLPRTDSRDGPAWRDAWRRKIPLWQVLWALMASPVIVTFGLFLLFRGNKEDNADVLIFGFIFFLLGVAAIWHGIDQLRMRWAAKRHGG
jgi:hypothetical protein